MISKKTLKLSLKSLRDFAKKRLPDQELIDLDARDECPLQIIRDMCDPQGLGIQLLFIPEEYGGFGGGAFDVYCGCEEMARIDLGVATAVLATFLGSDPIFVGATAAQKKLWLGRIRSKSVSGSMEKSLSTWSSICRCWAVMQTRQANRPSAFNAWITGASLMPSGRVPKMRLTFKV